MPWSELSVAHGMPRQTSNDGPILWTRPGEQVVPTADLPKSPYKRQKMYVRYTHTFYIQCDNKSFKIYHKQILKISNLAGNLCHVMVLFDSFMSLYSSYLVTMNID